MKPIKLDIDIILKKLNTKIVNKLYLAPEIEKLEWDIIFEIDELLINVRNLLQQ